jgi:hypothetical protein
MLERIALFSWMPFIAGAAWAQGFSNDMPAEPLIPGEYLKYLVLLIVGVMVYFMLFHKKRR